MIKMIETMEGTAEWSATGLENRGVVKHGGSIPLPSAKKESYPSMVRGRIANPRLRASVHRFKSCTLRQVMKEIY